MHNDTLRLAFTQEEHPEPCQDAFYDSRLTVLASGDVWASCVPAAWGLGPIDNGSQADLAVAQFMLRTRESGYQQRNCDGRCCRRSFQYLLSASDNMSVVNLEINPRANPQANDNISQTPKINMGLFLVHEF